MVSSEETAQRTATRQWKDVMHVMGGRCVAALTVIMNTCRCHFNRVSSTPNHYNIMYTCMGTENKWIMFYEGTQKCIHYFILLLCAISALHL